MQIQKIEDSQIDGVLGNKKSQTQMAGSFNHSNGNTFGPNKYMLKLPKTKKVQLSNGQVRYEHTEADYLPVAYVKVIRDAGVDTLASCQGRDNPSYPPDIDGVHRGISLISKFMARLLTRLLHWAQHSKKDYQFALLNKIGSFIQKINEPTLAQAGV